MAIYKSEAEIITIGDELLYGQVTDTNSQWISETLDKAGIKTIRKTTVGDARTDILTALKEAEMRANIVLITGGLGPTKDDLTKSCLAEYFNCEIALNEDALRDLTEFFKERGRALTEVDGRQAALPVCCQMLGNKLGTAPGMWFEKEGTAFVSMPGVPHEMKRMMTDSVVPRLLERFQTDIIHHKVVKTIGVGESLLSDMIREWEDNLPAYIQLAYLPEIGQVKLRLTGVGENRNTLITEVQAKVDELHRYAGQYIYGYDDDQLESVVGKMLLAQHKTIALAESCTGGYVSHLVTRVAGSSAYYQGSVIPYHNAIKTSALGVSTRTLNDKGAVSEETVHAMANLVRERFNADIGVATSGIAGPGGGTPDKPVGTVWIAYADGKQTITRKLQLWKNRELNIKATAIAVLNLVRLTLTKSD